VADFKRDVVDPDHFAPVHIDNLLIEQIAVDAKHVLVGVVRVEALVRKLNALFERDVRDLIVTDGKPGPAGTYKEAVNPRGMDERDDRNVAHTPDATVFQIVDRHPDQFCEEKEVEVFRRHVPPSVASRLA